MSISLSDIVQIFNLAEYVRPWLPWTWRMYATSALIWSAILFAGALVALSTHFIVREKSKVDWQFLKTGRPFEGGWQTDAEGNVINYSIGGFQLVGENVSGRAIHQISGELTLPDKSQLPLLIAADGQWTQTSQVEAIPRFAQINVGAQFRSDAPGWAGYTEPMKPDRFIQVFGGSTVSVTLDGQEQQWAFSVEDLRKAVDAQKEQAQEAALRLMRPSVHRKQ